MKISLSEIFNELSHVLGVCPECKGLFYLSEARPYLAGQQPKSMVDEFRNAEAKLDRLEDKLAMMESKFREAAAKAGLQATKKLLKKIDPVFSGAGYNPQDVKVIFNPVTYVVFDGLAKEKLKKIVLLASHPENAERERLYNSIDRSIRRGNLEFKTLHVDNQGQVSHR